MLSQDARTIARHEKYRDLVYATAELVSRQLVVGELAEQAVKLGKAFFHASSLEIHLRDAGLAEGAVDEAAVVMAAGSAMHVPIRFGDNVRGVISMTRPTDSPFDALDAVLFEKWALLLGVRIHELHLSAANISLQALAGVDGLTGIANRRAFGDMLEQAWERCRARSTSLAITMIDIDLFKSFNEKYGHVGGDACLKQIAKTISLSLRSADVVGRYGGEEFAVFFEATSLEVAIEVSERLRENISALGAPHLGSRLGHVTASIGVAAAVPRLGDDPISLLERADAALYRAKARGRNRVVAEGYVSASDAAVPAAQVRGNLPTPVSSFCGRHAEVQRVRSALDEARLVTIVGFGGIGKTRLTLEVASELAAGFRDGAWFVDLSGTNDGNVIAGLVASALELRDLAGESSIVALTDVCRNKAFLLVLDNCEHLLADCATLAASLLRAAPEVRILATSREPLDIPEELVLGLAPFAVPQVCDLSVPDALRVPAVGLFVDRARAVTSFELDDANVVTVLDVCRRVDGIALGIELAAARLKVLSLEQLRAELGRGLLARKSGGDSRQQTLWALIDWSFELLSEQQRRLFARIGIFAGSFTLEAATAVCADEQDDETVLDGLEALIDKSLLVVETRSDDRRTFRFFESLRSYARDRLAGYGELEALEARLRDYYLAVAAAAQAVRSQPNWLDALRPLEYASDDLRAILESTLGARRHVAAGAGLAADLLDYWKRQRLAREGRSWLERALDCEDETFGGPLRARVRLSLIELQSMGDAQARFILALEAGEALGDTHDQSLASQSSYHLGHAYALLGNEAAASEHLEAAQRQAEGCANLLALAAICNTRGMIAQNGADAATAIVFFTRCGQLTERINRGHQGIFPLGNLAETARAQGRFQEAIELAKGALAIAERNAHDEATAWLLNNLGDYYLAAGDDDLAACFAHDGFIKALEAEDEWRLIVCAETCARIAYQRGEAEIAAQLLGYAEEHLAALNVPRQAFEGQLVSELARNLRSALGREPLERLLAQGRVLTPQAILALTNARNSKALLKASLAS
jgi:diguanylate cyclase (GGDEF)-like protein